MSLQTGVLNFALITKLPHHHLLSLFHVHGVAISPPARPRAVPSLLPHPWLLPKRLGLSTRRHLPARTPRMDARLATTTMRRVVSCANSPLACASAGSPPFHVLRKRVSSLPLYSPSLLQAPSQAFWRPEPPLAPPLPRPPRSSSLRPSSAPNDPPDSSTSPP